MSVFIYIGVFHLHSSLRLINLPITTFRVLHLWMTHCGYELLGMCPGLSYPAGISLFSSKYSMSLHGFTAAHSSCSCVPFLGKSTHRWLSFQQVLLGQTPISDGSGSGPLCCWNLLQCLTSSRSSEMGSPQVSVPPFPFYLQNRGWKWSPVISHPIPGMCETPGVGGLLL